MSDEQAARKWFMEIGVPVPESDIKYFALELARVRAAALAEFTTLHPASEWTEADGAVLWWTRSGDGVRWVRVAIGTHWSRTPKVELPGEHAGPQ